MRRMPSGSTSLQRAVAAGLARCATAALVEGRRNPGYRCTGTTAAGAGAPVGSFDVCVHAVSVGEARAVLPVVRLQLRGHRLLITCTTPLGGRPCNRCSGQQTAASTAICYLPFDAPWLLQRFFASVRPKFGLLVRNRAMAGCLRRCLPLWRKALASTLGYRSARPKVIPAKAVR